MGRVLLVIPPDYDRLYPPLGTPALLAFLRLHGVPADQIDLNLPYRDFLASHLTRAGDHPHGVSYAHPVGETYPQCRGGLNLPYIVDKSDSANGGLSREERRFFLKPALEIYFGERTRARYYSACLPDASAGELPYGNSTNSSFYFCERLLSAPYLERYLADEEENTFLRYYRSCGILERITRDGISLVGISIISPAQAVAALTLGHLIKREGPGIHVAIGGQWPTLYRDELVGRKDLFAYFDSIVAGEGETALLALVRSLEAGRSAAGLPYVMTRGSSPGDCPRAAEEDMDRLPCPDFDGLPLAEYDGNADGEISLTYETSRGCYYSKCAYCVDLPLPKPSYRRKSPEFVARDMAELKMRFGAGYLLLGDPGLSPRQMAEVSRSLPARGVDIGWWTMARLDPGFTRELFGLAHRAGLRQVNFGFESACDRVCRALDKGNARERSSRVIRDCAAAGVRVDLQTMTGLPGESFEDGLETIDFLVSHKAYLSHVTFNTYYLTPGNFVYRDPGRYGVIPDRSKELPFRFFVPFRHKEGMTSAESATLQNMYRALVAQDGPAAGTPGEAAPSRMEEGKVRFTLGAETTVRFRRDPATEIYEFIK